MQPRRYRIINGNTYTEQISPNGERLWIPLLAGAAIISAPFWIGLGRNNNQCCYPPQYYSQPYYPQPYYQQPIPNYSQNYYYPTQPILADNNYYY